MNLAIGFCFLATGGLFFPPSIIWTIAMVSSSFLAGCCVAAWGFYFKDGTPKIERIKTAADLLIYSNILMIILNIIAIHIDPFLAVGFSMIFLSAAWFLSLRLPQEDKGKDLRPVETQEKDINISQPLTFLCLFVVVITINSGLMYQVVTPTFTHLKWLTSWYWAVPYIIALFIMRNLPRKTNRNYILYIAIAMIGFSFILFMGLDSSASSYLIINTLMLGAFGVYDLFWWSILGEMLDFGKNPAKILGIGLSANVLGVLLGVLLGSAITYLNMNSSDSTLLALGVVCLTLVILPPLHKRLVSILKDHVYLTNQDELTSKKQEQTMWDLNILQGLTEREKDIANLLLKGMTYRLIGEELSVSENTVRTHVKNIYSKQGVKSRMELMNVLIGKK